MNPADQSDALSNKGHNLLEGGRPDEAIELFKQSYLLHPIAANLASVVKACLHADHLEEAGNYVKDLIETEPSSSEHSFVLAGIVHWLSGKPNEAINEWENAIEAQYRDFAGGITAPLWLFFASVRRPRIYGQESAEKLINDRLKVPYSCNNWPAPLGKLLLELITDQEALAIAATRPHESQRNECRAQIQFWMGVAALAEDNPTGFRRRLSKFLAMPNSMLLDEALLAKYELKSR